MALVARKGLSPADISRQTQVLETIEAIKSTSLKHLITKIKNDITKLIKASEIIVYAVDESNNEIYSLTAEDNASPVEKRIPIAASSIPGYAAYHQKVVNIEDAYDALALELIIGKGVVFDDKWNKVSGFRTKQVLAIPFFCDGSLMGVIQTVNKLGDEPFGEYDIALLQTVGKALGVAVSKEASPFSGERSKFYHLVTEGVISMKALQMVLLEARQGGVTPESLLMRNHKITKEKIGAALSRFYCCRFVSFGEEALDFGVDVPMSNFRREYLLNELWFPLGTKNGAFYVTMEDPSDLTKRNSIKHALGTKSLKLFVSIKEDIEKFIERAFDSANEDVSSLSEILAVDDKNDDRVDLVETAKKEAVGVVVRIVNKIIVDACRMRASDIHIEPNAEDKNISVRFRIDGDCRFYQNLPYSYRRSVVSRIKVMSNLDTTNRRFPQDGKIKFSISGEIPVELRVATLPTQGGSEDVVMRILRKDETVLPVSSLQLSQRDEREFLKMLERPHGLILVVGPTGSGKTTTLHTALRHINKPDKKIWTAEDPVEITQHGLRQVQINPLIGFDFAMAMRAFLRADPDIIMVGEMRDYETAKMGIEASLTGHLVFSTLHTNSAVETVVRLLDIGIDRINFADSLVGVLSQRLIKRLCEECKEAHSPSEAELAIIEARSRNGGVAVSKNLLFYQAKGCRRCKNTGYWGRVGVLELLVASGRIRSLIRSGADITKLQEAARLEGMTSLFEDGLHKAAQALVAFDDVHRVCS